MKKNIIFIISILFLVFLLSSCNEIHVFPTVASLEETIKEIIISKGENYDFLRDELYVEKMNKLVEQFVDRDIIGAENFVFGNLDGDSIPEIIVFRQRDIDNPKDSGYLEVYSFNGETYSLLDSVEMNYDNSNYDLKAGKISPDKNGIYLNNKAGKGFGITYGFTLLDGKLHSILNGKKLNLISIDTVNTIEDIDKDGILEFSIYTLDPESPMKEIEKKDRLLLWYKWDGQNGGNLIKMEKIQVESMDPIRSNRSILTNARDILEEDEGSFIDYLRENKNELSHKDMTSLLKKHISNLNSHGEVNTLKLQGLYGEYKIPLDRINDKNYILSEDTISIEEGLKMSMVNNLKSGYKLVLVDGDYKYVVDYEGFLREFGENISNEYRSYLKILHLDNSQDMNFEKTIQKIGIMENFITSYPYSSFLNNIREILNRDMESFIKKIRENPLKEEEKKHIKENYSHTYLYDKIVNLLN